MDPPEPAEAEWLRRCRERCRDRVGGPYTGKGVGRDRTLRDVVNQHGGYLVARVCSDGKGLVCPRGHRD